MSLFFFPRCKDILSFIIMQLFSVFFICLPTCNVFIIQNHCLSCELNIEINPMNSSRNRGLILSVFSDARSGFSLFNSFNNIPGYFYLVLFALHFFIPDICQQRFHGRRANGGKRDKIFHFNQPQVGFVEFPFL